MKHYYENTCLLLGRGLLGLYFILPGLQKVFEFDRMSTYMASHDVPMIPVLLVLTIIIQLAAGISLIIGFKAKVAAFTLAGLTLVISLYMHNFWGMEEGMARMHEMQNFVKNMAIMAGLLIMSSLGSGKYSISKEDPPR